MCMRLVVEVGRAVTTIVHFLPQCQVGPPISPLHFHSLITHHSAALHSWNMQGANFNNHLSYSHPYSIDFDDQAHPYSTGDQAHPYSIGDQVHPYRADDHAPSHNTATLKAPSQSGSFSYFPLNSFQGTAAGTSVSEAMLIQWGEIPQMDVMDVSSCFLPSISCWFTHLDSRSGKGAKEARHMTRNATYATHDSLPNHMPTRRFWIHSICIWGLDLADCGVVNTQPTYQTIRQHH
jgi:hypothetical protein